MEALTRKSPAKLNLTLHVGPRRADGFHDVESLVAQIELADTVSVAPREAGRWAFECSDPTLPADGSNLALRAARALVNATGGNPGMDMTLVKKIPPGTGLGGGSSNAATALMLLNDLWHLGLSRDQLAAVGATLGSDVPLFLHEPLSVVRGRGEQVEEIHPPIFAWAAVLLPDVHCSTAAVYAAFDALDTHPNHPTTGEVLAGAESVDRLMDLAFNDLEEAAFGVETSLRELAERVRHLAGGAVRLTGSGSALYRLFDNHPAAEHFAADVTQLYGVRTVVTRLRTLKEGA